MLFFFVPAVVVGHEGEGGVGDLGFAAAFGFAEVGHADDVKAHLLVEEGFGLGAEGGAFHVDVDPAVVDGDVAIFGGLESELAEVFADGVGEADVGDDAVAEEGVVLVAFGAVEELVDDDDVPRFVLGLEGTDSAGAEDPSHAEGLHRVDVGAVVEFAGADAVAASVSGEEDDFATGEGSHEELIGGIAPGGLDLFPFAAFEALDVV